MSGEKRTPLNDGLSAMSASALSAVPIVLDGLNESIDLGLRKIEERPELAAVLAFSNTFQTLRLARALIARLSSINITALRDLEVTSADWSADVVLMDAVEECLNRRLDELEAEVERKEGVIKRLMSGNKTLHTSLEGAKQVHAKSIQNIIGKIDDLVDTVIEATDTRKTSATRSGVIEASIDLDCEE